MSLVVVAIIAAAAVAMVTWREEYRKDGRAVAQLNMIASNLHDYAARHGQLPPDDKGLDLLVADGQFRADALTDPWGRRLKYRCMDSACKRAEISSLGEPTASPPSPIVREVN
jgi:type II secretory pathway pseudopilin PulG